MSFSCEFCSKQFKRKDSCTRHLKSVHNRNSKGDFIPIREKFQCVLCDKQYSAKSSLDYHVKNIHVEGPKCCSYCSFKTCHRYRLEKHLKKHDENQASQLLKPFKCTDCDSSFINGRSLKTHKRVKHKYPVLRHVTTRKCPLCPYIAFGRSKKHIYCHFKNSHSISLKLKQHEFCSVHKFNAWKVEIEKKSLSYFYKQQSYQTKVNLVTLYHCHRNGIFKSVSSNKRRLKISGSCKINAFCPAFMKTIIDDKGVHVSYMATHIGHKGEIKHLRLKKVEKQLIAIPNSLETSILQVDSKESRTVANLTPPILEKSPKKEISKDLITVAAVANNVTDTQYYEIQYVEEVKEIANMLKSRDEKEWLKNELIRLKSIAIAMCSSHSSPHIKGR